MNFKIVMGDQMSHAHGFPDKLEFNKSESRFVANMPYVLLFVVDHNTSEHCSRTMNRGRGY